MKPIHLSATLFTLLACQGDPEPDLVIHNGTIYLDAHTTVNAIAIHKGTVQAVGEDVQIDTARESHDLQGSIAYPGFHDAHVHLLPGSFVLDRLVLIGASSMRTIEKKVESYAAENPDEPWIVGYGWISDLMDNPSGVALDALVSDRPILLVSNSAHQALVNTKALELAGINAETPDPPGGIIVRDEETGLPTGLLIEEALSLVSEQATSAYTDDAYKSGLENQLYTFLSGGVTSISEILAAPGFDLARPWIYTELDEAGLLSTRVHYYAPIFELSDVSKIAGYANQYDTDLVRFRGGKVWVDGSMSSGTPWVSEPHINDPENYGLHYFNEEALIDVIREAESLQVPLKFHVNGDAAVTATLNALETVEAENGGLVHAPVLDHIVLTDPDARARMARLGIIASVQPIHALTAHLGTSAEVWGEERYSRAYDSAAFVEAGVPIAMGTDWPVWPSPDAMAGVWAGVTGQGSRSLTMEDAFVGYTQGGALSVGSSEQGHLHPGAWADLVVYDQDIFTADPNELNNFELEHVFLAGKKIR